MAGVTGVGATGAGATGAGAVVVLGDVEGVERGRVNHILRATSPANDNVFMEELFAKKETAMASKQIPEKWSLGMTN